MVGEGAPTRVVVLYDDNKRVIDLVHSPIYHARSKRILAKHHFIRDRVHQKREIEIRKMDTTEMGVGELTKNASVVVVRYNRNLLGLA